MKSLLAITLCLLLSITPARAEDGACAGVKDGSVKFMNSPSCIKECAEDGGDCPYSARPQANPQVSPAPALHIKPEDKSCASDDDCALILTSCNSCCPLQEMGETAAVNKAHVQDYQSPDICTKEHIHNCGVPECGLHPAPAPAAVCQQGVCGVVMQDPQPRAP